VSTFLILVHTEEHTTVHCYLLNSRWAQFEQNFDIISFTGIRVHLATIAYSRDMAERVSQKANVCGRVEDSSTIASSTIS